MRSDLVEHLVAASRTALFDIPLEERSDVYVVSLFVSHDSDDPRAPSLTVGTNRESDVEYSIEDASDADEARWNYAFWRQDELAVIDTDRDPQAAALWSEWFAELGLAITDDALYTDAAEPAASSMIRLFVEACLEVGARLHRDGTIQEVFGRLIPVLVHELEYYDEIARQNLSINPNGLADAFAQWIGGEHA